MSARGVGEYEFNRPFVLALKSRLEAYGYEQTITLNEEGRDLSLSERVAAIGAEKTGILISIHHDSVQEKFLEIWEYQGQQHRYSDRYHGFSLFVSDKGAEPLESRDLATRIGLAIKAAGFVPSLHHAEKIPGEGRSLLDARIGLFGFDSLAILKAAQIPAVLIEVGIIVNRQEELIAGSPNFRVLYAEAIERGIRSYCSSRFGGESAPNYVP